MRKIDASGSVVQCVKNHFLIFTVITIGRWCWQMKTWNCSNILDQNINSRTSITGFMVRANCKIIYRKHMELFIIVLWDNPSHLAMTECFIYFFKIYLTSCIFWSLEMDIDAQNNTENKMMHVSFAFDELFIILATASLFSAYFINSPLHRM